MFKELSHVEASAENYDIEFALGLLACLLVGG
jgi:hypothetical protein